MCKFCESVKKSKEKNDYVFTHSKYDMYLSIKCSGKRIVYLVGIYAGDREQEFVFAPINYCPECGKNLMELLGVK